MKSKKILKLSVFVIIAGTSFFSVSSREANAFMTASHYTLAEQTAKSLPEDSLIRKAMEMYPDVAGWGANGPDLPLIQLRQAGGYAPWSDRYHYDRVGSMASEQLRLAIESKDLKKIAYAAGWVTHITGDLYCHGYYVNPEAGHYAFNPEGRETHTELEKVADPYLWVNMGNKSIESYEKTGIQGNFCDASKVPFDLMNEASNNVYGFSPNILEEKSWVTLYGAALKTGVGYKYVKYNDAVVTLSKNDRLERLTTAFNGAKNLSLKLFNEVEKGNDYSSFSDAWDTCASIDGRPIGTYSIAIHTGCNIGAGTNATVYLGMELENGTSKEWVLDKEGYNDFEICDNDDYYLYIPEKEFSPSKVKKVWIRINDDFPKSLNKMYLEDLHIRINGKIVLTEVVNSWLTKDDKWNKDVDWTSIPDAPAFE